MESAAFGSVPPADLVARNVYEADEVDEYVAYLHRELDALRADVEEARRLAEEWAARAGDTERVEALLGRALITAQRAADDAIADAERTARATIADAQRRADQIVADAERRATERQTGSEAPGSLLRDQAQRIVEEARRNLDALMSGAGTPRSTAPDQPAAFPWRPPVAPSDAGADVVRLPWVEQPTPPSGGPTLSERRPWRQHPEPGARRFGELQPTGTDAETRLVLVPQPEAQPAADWLTEESPMRATEALHAGMAAIRDRWRVARDGVSPSDEDLFYRPGRVESLQDGSYVETLRAGAVDADEDAPFPPPPPVRRRATWRERLFGRPGAHARF